MKAGMVLLAAIGLYVFLISASGRAAADLCGSHPVGFAIDDFEAMEGSFLLKRMGPVPDPDRPGARYAIFCASLTMCDTSCRLAVKDGVVVEARFLAL